MSCEDIPSLLDLQNTKKHVDDFGRLMGTGEGDSTNEVTGQVRPTYNKVMKSVGFKPGSGDFTTGFTVMPGERDIAWYDPVSQNWYSYLGVIPSPSGHPVAPGTNPVGDVNWSPRTDELLRSDLSSPSPGKGGYLVNGVTINFDNLLLATSYTEHTIGRKIAIGGYNTNSDGGYSVFEVVNSLDPVGILTDDGNFKIKRMSGHDYFQRAVRSGVGPKVIAHRGWSGITQGEYQGGLSSPVYFVPENTRAAIRFAAERGAWGVEGDTKITSDGVPVIFHDATTNRVCGVSGTIEGRTLAQVKALDAGSYVSSMYSDEKILTYPEWLYECRRSGVVAVAEWSAPMTLMQAQEFLDNIYKYFGPQPSNVILMSTYPATLELVRSLDAFICLVVMPGYGLVPTTLQLDLAYKLGNCGLMLTGGAITNVASVSAIKARGIPLLYAIANAPDRIENAISAGADGIITDCYRG